VRAVAGAVAAVAAVGVVAAVTGAVAAAVGAEPAVGVGGAGLLHELETGGLGLLWKVRFRSVVELWGPTGACRPHRIGVWDLRAPEVEQEGDVGHICGAEILQPKPPSP